MLWASTGTKDPKAPAGLYVEALAAPETIDTMPEKTLLAFAANGTLRSVMPKDGGDAENRCWHALQAPVSTSMRLPRALQLEGAESFVKSWRELMSRIAGKSTALATVLTPKTNPLAGHAAPARVAGGHPAAHYRLLQRAGRILRSPRSKWPSAPPAHRGSSFESSFNELHVLSISQAICEYRRQQNIDGPLFMGFDTHALSAPAFASALEVLAANGVEVMVSAGNEYTPTPAVSHAILIYNRGPARRVSPDGNPSLRLRHKPSGQRRFQVTTRRTAGPADTDVTKWIESRANDLLRSGAGAINRVGFAAARRAATTHTHDYLESYVGDLGAILDMDVIRGSRVRMGVDPLGGCRRALWARIAEVVSPRSSPW